MRYDHLELIRLQTDALFVHDANGKLVRINEPEPTNPAPRFFLGRTRAGHLWRTRDDVPDDLTGELGRLVSTEPVNRDLSEPPLHAADYIERLKPHAPHLNVYAGPAYYLPEHDFPNDVVLINADNINLVQAHFGWLFTTFAEYAPVVASVVAGHAVAVCFCSRITPYVAEAGVYTESAYRGRGYASKVVQGWAAALSRTGRLPLYSTTWANHASQAIARKLGAVQYGTDYSLT